VSEDDRSNLKGQGAEPAIGDAPTMLLQYTSSLNRLRSEGSTLSFLIPKRISEVANLAALFEWILTGRLPFARCECRPTGRFQRTPA
jgi:hypothetical protein